MRGKWLAHGDGRVTPSGFIVLGMGKFGAGELNYSSDIDLIVLYDRERASPSRRASSPRRFFVRLTRDLVQPPAGAHRGRLCLPHRPAPAPRSRLDASSRSRPSGARLLREPRPELGARRDDQGARRVPATRRRRATSSRARALHLAQISRLRRDRRHPLDQAADPRPCAATATIAVAGHNIKLGRGGIREIEFFVQTQQLIAGGRNPELRGRATLATLAALPTRGWITPRARDGSDRGLSVPARRSSTACRWSPTSRRTRCRTTATSWTTSRASAASPTRGAFADALTRRLRTVQTPLCGAVRGRARARRAAAAISSSPARTTIPRRSTTLTRAGLPPPAEVIAGAFAAGISAAIRAVRTRARARAPDRTHAGAV